MLVVGEEVAAKEWSLADITKQFVDMVVARAEAGKNYGVVLLPEGVVEFIPEIGTCACVCCFMIVGGFGDVLVIGHG